MATPSISSAIAKGGIGDRDIYRVVTPSQWDVEQGPELE
jgi:hypothetical protein